MDHMTNKPYNKYQHWKSLTLALSMAVGTSISTAEKQPTLIDESLETNNERINRKIVFAQFDIGGVALYRQKQTTCSLSIRASPQMKSRCNLNRSKN
ncbi:hypothetical protein SCARR_00439 [Pontiella sulfatireligans]|uniref:Uncharacterized protein n=1 Tax=Pontiella sulfatireligans TaxID=2750658 RepID=A0A6C2UFT0_9BACT|nr:hypothetical protein SCARR_00439 [Pontiella sulfatireligans]